MPSKKAYTLERACQYIAGSAVQGSGKGMFHVCSPIGWINDPNGFSVHGGKIHLFFQHYPYDTQWGPMHWGHAVTEDLVRWKLLPEALAPDMPYESGCFSGSALSLGDRHALIYTSHLETTNADGQPQTLQQQSLALGDGVRYEKSPLNPVITSRNLPPKASKADFRDPKVWMEHGSYHMAAANRGEDGCGQVLLYESDDLAHWRFVTVLDQSGGRLGGMWECPDFFPLDGRQLLLVCPQEMKHSEDGEFHAGNCTACLMGDWDEENKRFIRQRVSAIDDGWDFYAPQTTLLPDGRRVMIGWMQCWDNNVTPRDQNWSGMMTFPRELHVRDDCLTQLPVREIERFYAHSSFASGQTGKQALCLASGRHLDFTLSITDARTAVFHLEVAANGQYATRITYDAPAKRLVIDRSCAGMAQDQLPIQTIPLRQLCDTVTLRVLLDTWSMELFVNGGKQAVSVLLYTPLEAQDVLLHAPSPLAYALECHEIVVE